MLVQLSLTETENEEKEDGGEREGEEEKEGEEVEGGLFTRFTSIKIAGQVRPFRCPTTDCSVALGKPMSSLEQVLDKCGGR